MSDVEWAFEDSKRYPYSHDYDVGKDLGEYVLASHLFFFYFSIDQPSDASEASSQW
jgi:hypothetical protein